MNATAKILVVDDEKDVLKSLKDTLVSEQFAVVTAMTGQSGIETAVKEKPDVVLLDLRLPDIDGYDVCRELKKNPVTSHTPIIMISTRSKDTEKVIGLEMGADDYLTKPFNSLELVARIRVALRRTKGSGNASSEKSVQRCGPVEIDLEARTAKINSKPVKLTRKEYDLLSVLISKPGKVFSRRALMESVWGYAYDTLQGTVDSHVKTLRKKIGTASKMIETVTGIGYKWTDPEE